MMFLRLAIVVLTLLLACAEPAHAQTAPPPPPSASNVPAPPPAGLTPALVQVNTLIRNGEYAAAAEQLDTMLAQDPRNPQLRFMKAAVQGDRGAVDEARETYQGMTQDYPELPEPYNNLAVILAQQGEYEKARGALELAIKARPDYAIAHENLGDVYARLAGVEYDRAIDIDRTNASARKKLDLVKDLYAVLPSGAPSKPAPPKPPDAQKK